MPRLAPVLLLAALACESPPDFEIVPGERAGPVTALYTWEDLQETFRGRVVREDIPMGEGFTQPGVIAYPDEPRRRIEFVWDDSLAGGPAFVILRGDSSAWHTTGGLTLGTSLRELEEINGGPFRLAGFGWDYGGTVMDWQGGTLARDSIDRDKRPLIVRLYPSSDSQIPRDLLGDTGFASDDPGMVALAPRVTEIYVPLR